MTPTKPAPQDWPGTPTQWQEYQELAVTKRAEKIADIILKQKAEQMAREMAQPENKIVKAIESLTAAWAAMSEPKENREYEVVAQEIRQLSNILSKKLNTKPLDQAKGKWTFTVKRNAQGYIESIEAERID